MARHALVRPRLAPPSEPSVDETRVHLEQILRTEPELLHDPGAVWFDQHVGITGKPAQYLAALLQLEVERDRALAASKRIAQP